LEHCFWHAAWTEIRVYTYSYLLHVSSPIWIKPALPCGGLFFGAADLFLVLIIELLKHNGRAAVVLPDGTLFGERVKTRIKEELLTECNLHTVVRLPNGVFAPCTGIKTSHRRKRGWGSESECTNREQSRADAQ
jgi:hypothetical protein